ncbi:cell division protein CrgA [Amycolatopsis sp. NPDC059657]|uniref:cell division protein CrgA n=1 Tax=Amycolatopsis sp. NPDC059657 TaxID=3346899 RepID=UPI00367215F6
MGNEEPIRPMGRRQRIERRSAVAKAAPESRRPMAPRARAREERAKWESPERRRLDALVFTICPLMLVGLAALGVYYLFDRPAGGFTLDDLSVLLRVAGFVIMPVGLMITRVRARRRVLGRAGIRNESNRSGR